MDTSRGGLARFAADTDIVNALSRCAGQRACEHGPERGRGRDLRERTADRAGTREDALLAHPGVDAARACIRETDEQTIADMVAAVQIPAPPFGEKERGAWMCERFRSIGLADVVTDEIGNVLARL